MAQLLYAAIRRGTGPPGQSPAAKTLPAAGLATPRTPVSRRTACSDRKQLGIPHATVKIYPDSAHGFLFQHHAEFAADVEVFLAKPD
ncbi:MAG TPA: hypothetical protein VNW93_08820 [Mycobacterium sp.]|nr:hypothetical protein [Mycobacterium sp.]